MKIILNTIYCNMQVMLDKSLIGDILTVQNSVEIFTTLAC